MHVAGVAFLFLGMFLLVDAPGRADPGPSISIRLTPAGDPRAAFEVVGIDPSDADGLSRTILAREQW